MVEIDRAERARQQRLEEQAKEKEKPKTRESDFDQFIKKSTVINQPVQKPQLMSKTATEDAIREAVKQEERRGDDQKKDDRDKDKGRDSRQEGEQPQGKIAEQKVIAKGRLKQGQGQSQGQGKGSGFGMASSRKGFSKVLQKGGARSVPIDLKGKFAQKLTDAMKKGEPDRAALSQQVLNKMIQYVRVGINTKGEKEIRMELNERIFRGLKLRVIARGGKVHVTFATQDARGKEVLEKNKDGLKKALGEKGIDVEEIVVA
jgi:hypothetical protein